MQNKLPPEYKLVTLPQDEFEKYWDLWGPKIFQENDTSRDAKRVHSEEERAKTRHLYKNMTSLVRMNLCIFKGEEFCGWFTGDQYNGETFYMRNSAILPDHRRKGLYTILMHAVLERVKELGFQIVLSRHTTTNNSIIIPNLKAGFVITPIKVQARFGTLVHLSYFFNETRRQIMEFRAGDLKPDQKIKDALGII